MRYENISSTPVQPTNRAVTCGLFAAFLMLAVLTAFPKPGFGGDITLAWDANTDANLGGYKIYYGTDSRRYGTPIDAGNKTVYTISGLAAGTYYFAVTAYNTSGQESGYSNEVTGVVADAAAPAIAITSPTSAATFGTASTNLNLGGTASDDAGVTEVTWSNSAGGGGTAAGTNAWSVSGIALVSGTNTITVTARDAGGNTASATLTVTCTSDSAAPLITITSPTSAAIYLTNSGTLNLGGTASDNVGVTQVSWSNSAGGSGTAAGTAAWSVSGITLAGGTNTIGVTARDEAGNNGSAKLVVTCDQTPPVISAVSSSAVKNTAATITWNSDEASDSQVEYGETSAYGSASPASPVMTVSHTQTLGNLTRNTTYHFRVKSKDQAGNLGASSDFTFRTADSPDIMTGLVAAYAFDEGTGLTTADASGHSRTATLKGASWSSKGKYGAALSFNGKNNYLFASSLGMPAANQPLTIAYWTYTLNTVTSTQSNVTLASSALPAAVEPGYKDSQVGVRQYGNLWLVVGIQPSSKAWHHFAYTYDGQTHCFYVDGKLVSSSTVVPQAANPDIFEIGRGGEGSEYFKGIIDEVFIFSRALNQAEIEALMITPIGGL